jgi:predicted lipoprotein with Yx(FWY)xxD motif
MLFQKRLFAIIPVLLLTLVFAACGTSTTSTGSSGSTGSTVVSTPTTANNGNGYNYGSGSTPTPATSAAVTIHTATASINGSTKTILTNAQGMTLYYFTPDTASTSACQGGCASTWPPLLSTGSGIPTSTAKLSGTLSVKTTGNGNQVEYNGHLLYTYVGDTAAGQLNGQGIGGKWFVATTDLS